MFHRVSLAGTVLVLCVCCIAATAQASARRQRAFALERQGKFAAASAIWQSILSGNSRDAEAYAHLGLDEARRGLYSDAIKDYRRALAIDPGMAGLKIDLALSYFKLSQFRNAIPLLKEELKQHPDNQRLTVLLGMAHYGAGEYAAAVPYLRAAAARERKSAAIRLPLAQACLWSRQFKCVLATYQQILALNGASVEADMLAGEAYDAQGDTAAATRQFRAAVQADPKEPEVHFGLGYLLWTQRHFKQAAKEFRAELKNNPEDGQSMAYLGDSLMHQGEQAEAARWLKQAITLKTSLELAHLDLGIINASDGNKAEAVDQFRSAITLNPKATDPRWRLARLYQSMGKRREAQAEFESVRKMNRESAQDLYMKMAGSPTARSAQTRRAQGNH